MNADWQNAQRNEADFWKNFILHELKPASRDQVVGFRSCEFRFALTRLGYPWHDWQFSRHDSIVRGKWLDVGCGPVSMLEGSPVEFLAIDPGLKKYADEIPYVSHAPKPQWNNMQYSKVAYHSCKIQDVQDTDFDYVWCFNVLDHTDDWQDIVVNIGRVLKRGGTALISTDVRTFTDQYHIAIFTANDLMSALNANGLVIDWHSDVKQEPLYRFNVRAVKI